ncbi:hypothetical protein BGZ96_008255 [Linnemannia gamsii]|uniref:Uncharacterized protein n=1 Tax=Linnemannia gamsii TaxID=64522 RepID=A0ABQ7JYQ1_9FUNG|nr:hypothetical protein BGZ96_008255 [Linnemannia gamsii]
MMRPLPVPVRRQGELYIDDLCLECRRKEFNTDKEPYPPGVTAYTYPSIGAEIRPRIIASEARSQYCLKDYNFQNLPCITVKSVRAVGEVYDVNLYEEEHIIDQARWLYGGEVGIAHARMLFATNSGRLILPPVGDIRERRNMIRQVFMNRDLFADPDLAYVKRFVDHNEGSLVDIVRFNAK